MSNKLSKQNKKIKMAYGVAAKFKLVVGERYKNNKHNLNLTFIYLRLTLSDSSIKSAPSFCFGFFLQIKPRS